ncbi:MAG: alpha/beta fold hydrolase [Planctomycetaceae bacterium]
MPSLASIVVRCLLVAALLGGARGASGDEPAAAEAGALPPDEGAGPEELALGTHGVARSGDVDIHYVVRGEGPLVVLIHGFPDYWYTWRAQMPELSRTHRVVAIDQRGYNRSGQPAGVEAYAMDALVADVRAVIDHLGAASATIVGHDWGGMVAWRFAMTHPEATDGLVVLNLPHPNGLLRELANNPEQRENSAYARFFQSEEAVRMVAPEVLVRWVKDPAAQARHLAAMRRSSMAGMLAYYKANYPREPYAAPEDPGPPVRCRVLLIHGLRDKALLAGALNDTWKWVEKDLTLVTIPEADHFVQHDAAGLVTRSIADWLSRDVPR